MDFPVVLNRKSDTPPTRLYLHREFLTDGREPLVAAGEARDHFLNIREKAPEVFTGLDYVLGILWKDPTSTNLDLFGYKDIARWPGNPEVSNWVFKNGVFLSTRNISCGDSLILLGREEHYRRTCANLETYFSRVPPSIPVKLKLDESC